MKKISYFVSALFFIISLQEVSASAVRENNKFFFKPALTVEYSAPATSNGGDNADFNTTNFGKQLTNFQNIAIGGHFRVHKNLGFNINWQQAALENNALQDAPSLASKANLKLNQYNFSALFFTPKVENALDFFAEVGVSDINSKLSYVRSNGSAVVAKSHQTVGLIGVGLQFSPFEKSDDAIRFSVQRYLSKIDVINAHYTTVRIGYVKFF